MQKNKLLTKLQRLKKSRSREEEGEFEDAFYAEVDRKAREKESDYSKVPEFSSSAVEGQVQDILDLMGIPASYEIKKEVLMPDDFSGVSFSTSIPEGYDSGEVDTFVSRAMASVDFYVSLLKERNAHVAWLATAIDKLQVDINNLRYDQESSQGVSISLTGDPSLETDLSAAKLKIKQLEDRLSEKSGSGSLERIRTLEDKLAYYMSVNGDLEQEVEDLRGLLEGRAKKEEAQPPTPLDLPDLDDLPDTDDSVDEGLIESDTPKNPSHYGDETISSPF